LVTISGREKGGTQGGQKDSKKGKRGGMRRHGNQNEK
jgi:hypothetical protein